MERQTRWHHRLARSGVTMAWKLAETSSMAPTQPRCSNRLPSVMHYHSDFLYDAFLACWLSRICSGLTSTCVSSRRRQRLRSGSCQRSWQNTGGVWKPGSMSRALAAFPKRGLQCLVHPDLIKGGDMHLCSVACHRKAGLLTKSVANKDGCQMVVRGG